MLVYILLLIVDLVYAVNKSGIHVDIDNLVECVALQTASALALLHKAKLLLRSASLELAVWLRPLKLQSSTHSGTLASKFSHH